MDVEKDKLFSDFINIETTTELSEYMKSNLKYCWNDKKGNTREDFNNSMFLDYSLMMPTEVLLKQHGICMDQVELEREWFKHKNIKHKTIGIQLLRKDTTPGHVFLVYEENTKWYWFENAWSKMKGIHEYNNLDFCLKDITNKFIKQNNILDIELDNLEIYEYGKYPPNINYQEIQEHDKLNNNKIYIKKAKK